jgi:hypothetical protein
MKEFITLNKKILLVFLIIFVILIIAEFIRSNTYIQTEKFIFSSEDIPESFNGTTIVHISDYHYHGGQYDERLIDEISKNNPDYIFLTGDITDSICTDIDKSCAFLEMVSEIAPCYLVWGNHDYNIDERELDKVRECAVNNRITVLENDFAYIEKENDKILVVGTISVDTEEMMKNYPSDEKCVLWLHHYPEDFKYISMTSESAGSKADLIFCGHAHGGLIRFPFINGIYAPGQGFFPEYTSGRYEYNGSEMLVSRGVGNSGYTRRFADPFHLVVCTLERSEN